LVYTCTNKLRETQNPGSFPEWAYKNIAPRVLFEELLISTVGIPEDYRFFVFNGHCNFISIDTPTYSGEGVKRDIFDRNWNRQKVTLKYPNSKRARSRPGNLSEMIQIAESLAIGIDQIRVDLYSIQEKIIFGELTNYHAAGGQKFDPEQFDKVFGSSWNPEKLY